MFDSKGKKQSVSNFWFQFSFSAVFPFFFLCISFAMWMMLYSSLPCCPSAPRKKRQKFSMLSFSCYNKDFRFYSCLDIEYGPYLSIFSVSPSYKLQCTHTLFCSFHSFTHSVISMHTQKTTNTCICNVLYIRYTGVYTHEHMFWCLAICYWNTFIQFSLFIHLHLFPFVFFSSF